MFKRELDINFDEDSDDEWNVDEEKTNDETPEKSFIFLSKRLRRARNVAKIVENSLFDKNETENFMSARRMINDNNSSPPPSTNPQSAETSSPINYSGRTPPPSNLLSSNNDIEKNLCAIQSQLVSTAKSQKIPTGQKRVKCDTCSKTFLRISSHKCKGQKPSLI